MKNRILTLIIGIIVLFGLGSFVYGAEAIAKDEALIVAKLIDSKEGFNFVNLQIMQGAPYTVTSDQDVLSAFAQKVIEFKISPTPDWIKRNADLLPADMQKKLPDVELKEKLNKAVAESKKEEAAAQSNITKTYAFGGIGIVLVIVLLFVMKGRYGSWKKLMASPSATQLGAQAASEVTANQETIDELLRQKQAALHQFNNEAGAGNITEARRIMRGNG